MPLRLSSQFMICALSAIGIGVFTTTAGLLLSAATPVAAYASPASDSQTTVGTIHLNPSPNWNPESDRLLRYDAINYFYSPDSGRELIFQSVSAHIPTTFEGTGGKFVSDLEGIFTLTPTRNFYFEAPELYYQPPAAPVVEERLQFSFGRKLETWSTLDNEWHLGIWQPRFRWDYLHPETVGLSGFFTHIRFANSDLNTTDTFSITAMGSPLFIPERGVPITVSDGRFTSPSPWFIPPSSRIVLFGTDAPINYSLVIPPTGNIVQQTTVSLLARLESHKRSEGKRTWIQGAFASKPMNQLLMGYVGSLGIIPPADAAQVTIQPRVGYHQLMSLEVGHKNPRFSGVLSGLYERTYGEPIPALWTYQVPQPAYLLSPTFVWGLTNDANAAQIDFSYLKTWGGNGPDRGYDNRTTSVFEGRYPFQNTLRAGISGQLHFLSKITGRRSHRFFGAAHYTYDLEENGSILSSDFQFLPKDNWSVKLSADLLATDVFGPTSGNVNRFISRYQVNNRVQAGVSYVF